jgi:hypothetical protein
MPAGKGTTGGWDGIFLGHVGESPPPPQVGDPEGETRSRSKCCQWRSQPACTGAANGMSSHGDWMCPTDTCGCVAPTNRYPKAWKAEVASGNLLVGGPDEPGASIGNGYVGAWVPRGMPGSAGAPVSGVEHVKGVFKPMRAVQAQGEEGLDQVMQLADLASWTSTAYVERIGTQSHPAVASAMDLALSAYRVAYASGTVECEQVTYAHRAEQHLLVTSLRCTNTGTEKVSLTVKHGSCEDQQPQPAGYKLYPALCPKNDANHTVPGNTVDGYTRQAWNPGPTGKGAACSMSVASARETPSSRLPLLGECHTQVPAEGATVHVPPNQHEPATVLTLYSARYSNIDPPTEASSNADQATLIALARNAWIDAVAAGGEALLESHAAAMERLHTPGIEVEGNVTLARVVNASLHALLVSFREDSDQSSAPEGLISTRYSGHAFWDVETWQWPTWLLFWPEQARKVLDYRARLSQQAADNARFPSALPYFNRSDTRIPYPQLEGLRFPWESALTGIEMCPGNGEDHIMGDIATAFRQYYWATQDGDWLNQTGWPVIQGIAQFYASRVTVDPRNASIYHIVGSMGPDEYHGNVTDSAYGNWVARASLLAANRFAPLVDVAPNATFQAIADGLVIPYDATSDYHPEYQGFSPSKSGLIKQADTLLMYYPLAAPQVKAATRRNDVNVYTKQTDPHGPAMTYTIHSIVSLDIGDDEQADGFFRDGFSNFTRAPFYLWHEGTGPEGSSKQGAPNLVTGAGGFLQNCLGRIWRLAVRSG